MNSNHRQLRYLKSTDICLIMALRDPQPAVIVSWKIIHFAILQKQLGQNQVGPIKLPCCRAGKHDSGMDVWAFIFTSQGRGSQVTVM